MKVIPSIGYRLDILRENLAPDPEFGHVSENLAYLSENGQTTTTTRWEHSLSDANSRLT